jgi:putative transposase
MDLSRLPGDVNTSNENREANREGEAPAEPSFCVGSADRAPHASIEPFPTRRHPVHGIKFVDGQPTIIFDTICTKHRAITLANNTFHDAFRCVATGATAWLMGRYVIMPDHIHFFAGDCDSDVPYENWITYLKSQLTKTWNRRHQPGGRGDPSWRGELGGRGSRRAVHDDFRWQPDHWDTRIRSAEIYEEKWQYFLNNPVRKGLVSSPGDWPFQGEIFELRW